MMKKRLTALLMALVMICSLLPVNVRADDPSYEYDDETKTLELKNNNAWMNLRQDQFNPEKVEYVVFRSAVDQRRWNNHPMFMGEFGDYKNLRAFIVDSGNTLYREQDGVLYSVLEDGDSESWLLICYPAKKGGSAYVLPPNVTEIANYAFKGVEGITIYCSAEQAKTIDKDGYGTGASLNLVLNDETNPVPSVVLKVGDTPVGGVLTLEPTGSNSSVTLTADVGNATVQGVTWSSSDKTVATVDANGVVTAQAPGTAVITATSVGRNDAGEHVSATCDIIVKTPVSGLTIPAGTPGADGATVEVDTGAADATMLSVQLNASATYGNVTWTSGDTTVATLNAPTVTTEDEYRTSTVAVVPQGTGDVTVTATADDDATKTATFTLHLSEWAHSVSLSENEIFLLAGDKAVLTATAYGADGTTQATIQNVNWSVDGTGFVSVVDGTITANAPGDAVVTATSADIKAGEIKTSCTVKVRGIALYAEGSALADFSLRQHDTRQLTAAILPTTAEQSVTWSSDHPEIVAVDESTGVVTAIASSGTATITATSKENGLIAASVTVTATDQPVVSVTLSESGTQDAPFVLAEGATATLTATLHPANATNQKLIWETSESTCVAISEINGTPLSDAVEVDENGEYTIKLTALKEGTAIISVRGENGTQVASLHVLVPIKATGLSFSPTSLTLGPKGSGILTPIFEPVAPTSRKLEWNSSKPELVSVEENEAGQGVVTVNPELDFTTVPTPFTVTITATTENGKNALCTVTVERNKVTSVGVSAPTLELDLTETKSARLTATVLPENASITTVQWSTSNANIATVDSNGTVTAKGVGDAVITVTTDDGAYTATCAVKVNPTRVTSLTLSAEGLTDDGKLRLAEGDSARLTATLSPYISDVGAAATDGVVLWESSNSEVVEVSHAQTTANPKTGETAVTVTVKKTGTATITAKAHDNTEIFATCEVTIPETPVTSLTLDQSEVTLELNSSTNGTLKGNFTLTATIDPPEATLKGVTWSSGDPEIATVSSAYTDTNASGEASITVTAQKSGDTKIFATSADGECTEFCTVHVRWVTTGVEISKRELTLNVDDTQTLTAAIKPNGDNLKVVWSSSNENIATVDQSGNVTAVAPGTADITAKAVSLNGSSIGDHAATCAVTVKQPATEIKLDLPLVTLDVEDSKKLAATITPSNHTDEVVWSTSNATVATVKQDAENKNEATVTAVSGGTAVITVKAGSQTVSCTVNVNMPLTGLHLNKTAVSLGIGDIEPLTAIFEPYNATDRGVTWTVTQDEEYITVSEDGVVTANAVQSDGEAATATVTATSKENSEITATCTVRVVPTPATGVQLGGNIADGKLTMNMVDKTTADLTATILPKEATDKTLKWESSDTGVVTFSTTSDAAGENGVSAVTLAAVHPGTAVVTVTTTSGGFRAVCHVTVEKTAVTSVVITPEDELNGDGKLSVVLDAEATLTGTINPDGAAATYPGLIWTVGDSGVVELNTYSTVSDGEVVLTANRAGETTVTATSVDDGSKYAVLTVVVPSTPVSTLTLDKTELKLTHSAVETLTATVSEGATNSALNWSSSNTGVATVQRTGENTAIVRTVGYGTATITVTPQDGSNVSAACEVTVWLPAERVTLSATSATLTFGSHETETITATVGPTGAKQAITWTSSDDTVATVLNGVITAQGPGTAKITATATGYGYSAECAVTVENPTKSVSLSPTTLNDLSALPSETNSATLTATVTPTAAGKNVTDTLTWTTSDKDVATVTPGANNTATVTAVGGGTATITAISGGQRATCEVTIPVPVTEITLSPEAVTIGLGQSATLTPFISPSNATNKAVNWSVNDEGQKYITVDGNGVVTPKDNIIFGGAESVSATVTATAADGSGVKQTCVVTVQSTKVTRVTLDSTLLELDLTDNKEAELKASLDPSDATIGTVTWVSDHPEIARITGSGSTVTIEAVSPGSAIITVTTDDGGHTAKCAVTVAPTSVTEIELNTDTLNLGLTTDEAKTGTLTATVTPAAATDPAINWASADTTIATVSTAQTTEVDANGKATVTITAHKAGTVLITATTRDGALVKTCTVTVAEIPVTKIELSKYTSDLLLGENDEAAETRLTAAVSPENASYPALTWSSSDDSIVEVTANGESASLKAKGTGTASVTVTTSNGVKAVCEVTVRRSVTGVEMEKGSTTIPKGEKEQLSAAIKPDPANQSLTWSSDHPEIASVDSATGLVTAKAVGTAVITAKASNGNFDVCTVTVTQAAGTLELNQTSLRMSTKTGESDPNTFELVATITPADASDAIVWSVSTNGVVTLNEPVNAKSGDTLTSKVTLTAVKGGVADVTVTVGSLSPQTCTITVPTPVTGVELNKKTLTLGIGGEETLIATVKPGDATDQTVTWSVNDDGKDYVSVDSDGKVTAKAVKSDGGAATATVTVTTADGSYSDTCTVTVEPTAVSSIALSGTGLTNGKVALTMQDSSNSATLTATINANATDKTVTWTSSDPTVVKVAPANEAADQDGRVSAKITAQKPGSATITVRAGDRETSCLVTVDETAVTGVSITPTGLTGGKLALNDTATLTGRIAPDDATVKTIVWTCFPAGILTLDKTETESGEELTIEAVQAGEVTVTATSKSDGSKYVTLTVTVPATPVDSITLSETSLELTHIGTGTEKTLAATVTDGATNPALNWRSSNTDVVTVDGGRLVTKGPGTAIITVSPQDGSNVSVTCTVTVYLPVTRLALNKYATTLVLGSNETETLIPTVSPVNDCDDRVVWTTSDPDVVTVDETTGAITAVAPGTATITATSAANEAAKDTCSVTVIQPSSGVTVTPANQTLTVNGGDGANMVELSAVVLPDGADQTVTWSSNNEHVATVDANGVVTAHHAGEATITAADARGTKGNATITVVVKASGVTLNKSTLSLEKGRSETLTATVTPDEAADKTVTWESKNQSVATVDSSGKVTAVADSGSAEITATVNGITASCTVQVGAVRVTGFATEPKNITIARGETGELTASVAPTDAGNREITWSSSNESVAKVTGVVFDEETGIYTATVSALAVGAATITAQTSDNNFTARCIVTVPDVGATNLRLDASDLALYKNIPAGNDTLKASYKLAATLTPSESTDAVTWLSTNTGVATVDQQGNVTAVSGGRATIIATAGGKSAQCLVTVTVLASGLTLSNATLSLENGKSATLTASVPEGTSETTLKWTSSDDTVAEVNGGVVTAHKVSDEPITITVETTDGSGLSKTCALTVTAAHVDGVSLAPAKVTLFAGETQQLTATVSPANAGNPALSWESSNNSVATVSSDGLVTAVAANADGTAATATITAKTADGEFTATCDVTVQPTAVTSIEGLDETLTINFATVAERTQTLTAAAKPDNATNKTLVWSSGNTEVVTVDSATGAIKALKPGVAVITVYAQSNASVKATCTVTVNATAVTGVSLDLPTLDMDLGEEKTLHETVEPSGADDKGVMWSSSNEQVATVTQNGKVTATGAGYAVITVTTNDQKKTATCIVHAWQMVESVSTDGTLTLDVGASQTLTATISPNDAVNQRVTWSSGNSAVATVDSSGKVTGVSAGETTITVTTEDQNKTFECTVTVNAVAVTDLTLSKTTLTLTAGDSTTLTAAVLPANATDKTVTWSVETGKESVVTVNSSTGEITAHGAGEATITATCGSATKTCAVTVQAVPQSVTIRQGDDVKTALTIELPAGGTATAALSAVVGPSGADQTVTWSSSNTAVAEVSADGAVTAKKGGTAVITAASAADPTVKGSCTVTVTKPATELTLTASAETIDLNTNDRTVTISAAVEPADSTDAVTWTITAGSAFVQLSAETGSSIVVYGRAAGTATITATCGGVSETQTITVQPVTDAGVTLDTASLTLEKGAFQTLTATVWPANAGDTTVTWSISPAGGSVATVDTNGTVTAVGDGTATVTATTASGKTAQCEVTVTKLLANSVTVSGADSVEIGNTITLTGAAARTDGKTPDVDWSWSSSNPLVAVVNENTGVVSALSVGTTQITVTDRVSGKSASKLVSVTPIELTALSLGDEDISLAKGETEQLTAESTPSNATYRDQLLWSSSNVNVATVSADGLVTAVDAGTAIITVTSKANTGVTASRTVVVTAPVTGVALDRSALSLTVGGSDVSLTASVLPANAAFSTVTWTSSNNDIVTVTDGVVHAVAKGSATITATVDGKTSAPCTVTVTQPVTGVTLDRSTLTLTVNGAAATLTPTVLPQGNASNTNVTWSSSNNSVATVLNGEVTPVAAGTALIFVTTEDGGKTAYCTVTVVKKATGVTLDRTTLSLTAGSRDVLTATVQGDASDPTVTWTCVNEDTNNPAVSVDTRGIVTALNAGSATVTATANDGSGFSATCTVTVIAPITAVSIRKDGATARTLALDTVTATSAALTCDVTVAGGTPTVAWTSSDSSVAIVDNNGIVTVKGAGTAIITATATVAGGGSMSADCTVTVTKPAVSADTSRLMLLGDTTSGTVTFDPCASDAAITWTGGNEGIVTYSHTASGNARVYTFTARGNGVVTLTWSKEADSKYAAANGSVTVVSLPNPITGVSVGTLESGSSLIAELSGSSIIVSGYVKDEDPSAYDLSGKLSFTLATDVVGTLSTAWSGDTVQVKYGDNVIRTYTVVRSIVTLPAATLVTSQTRLVAPTGTTAEGAITDATVSNLKAASLAEIKTLTGCEDATEINTEIVIEPLGLTRTESGGVSSLTLDITPTYTVKHEGNAEPTTGTLSEVSASVLIEVTVNFKPTLIEHEHDGAVEYLTIASCVGPDANGMYTVSWYQSSFSTVRLLADSSGAAVTPGTVKIVYTDGQISFQKGSGVGACTAYLAAYNSSDRMLSIQTIDMSKPYALAMPTGGTYYKVFVLDASGRPLAEALRIN